MMRSASTLTLAQRVSRIPHCPGWLYTEVMRVRGDLAIANRVPTHLRKAARSEAMRYMALALNALRRAEKAAGLVMH